MKISAKPFFKKQNEILNLADAPTRNERRIGKRVLPIDVTLFPVEFTKKPPSGFRGRKSFKHLFKSFRRRRATTSKHAAQRSHASRWRATPFTSHKTPASSKDTPRQSRLFPGGSEFTRLEVRKLRQVVEENVDGPRRTRFMIHWDGLLLLESSDAGTNASVDSATIDASGIQDGAVDAGAVDAGAFSTVQEDAVNAEPVSTNHSEASSGASTGTSSTGVSHSTGVGSTVRFADQVSLPPTKKTSSVDAGKTSSTVPVCAALSAQSNSPDRSGPQDPQCSPPQTQQTQQKQQKQQKQHQPRPLGLKLIRVVAHTADCIFPEKAAADFGSAGSAGPTGPSSPAFALAPVRWVRRLGARAARFTSAVREDFAFRRQERKTTREVKKQEKKLRRLDAERLFDSLVSRARAAAFECVHADLDQKAAAACQLQQARQARQAVYALHAQRRVAHAKAKAEAKETENTAKAPKTKNAPLSPRPSNSPSISPRALRSTAASSVSCRHCLLCLQCRSSLHCHVCGRKRPLAA